MCIGSAPSTPAPPPLPPAAPPPPTPVDPKVQNAVQNDRIKALQSKGRAAAILTSPLGLTTQASTTGGKTLLGQ